MTNSKIRKAGANGTVYANKKIPASALEHLNKFPLVQVL
jgi:hypothetical protein